MYNIIFIFETVYYIIHSYLIAHKQTQGHSKRTYLYSYTLILLFVNIILFRPYKRRE